MRSRIKKGIAVVAAAGAAMAGAIGTAGNSSAAAPSMQAVGITDSGTLMAAFNTTTPNVLDWVQEIDGLSGDTAAIGIDWRVQDNTLYLVGDQGGIYTVDVTEVPGQPVVALKVSQLTVTLSGNNFGVDFNPAADRLRIISDNGQNLRHNLNDHTTTKDMTLSPAVGNTAAAYTNNDLNGETNTTLFDIDTYNDQVVIQSPPNAGNLVATGKLTVDAGPNAGFDIFSDRAGGKTVANIGFGAFVTGGKSTFYTVDVLTGAATSVNGRAFPLQITDIAIPLDTD